MKIVIAGFGYGANLSAVVCWDSKTFWRRPWESRPKMFFSERSNVILSYWLLFTRVWFIYQQWDLIPTGSTVVFPCASVRTAPLRSLTALLCVPWLQRALTETRRCCCASMGFVLEGICDSFANACYSRSSLEQDSPQTSLSRSRHRMKRWTTVLSVLTQAIWQFWNVVRNGSLLYLISIHKVFDFMRMNLIICIGLYAYALHYMHIHLIICICIFLFAYALFNLHMHFWISICICLFAYALYAMS